MKRKFAYSTNAFRRFSLIEAAETIAACGYDGVEIMADRPHLYPPDWSASRLEDLRLRLQDMKLAVSNLNAFTLFAVRDMHHPSWIEASASDRRKRLDHTLRCIDAAHALNCRNISIQPGGKVEAFSRERSIEIFAEGLQRAADQASAAGVRILVEPEPALMMENSSQFGEFVSRFPHPAVGLNLDVGHFVCAGEDPVEVITKLSRYAGHAHMEDIKGRIHDHKIIGDGDIDFPPVFRAFDEAGYEGWFSVELYPYQDDPRTAGLVSLQRLRELAG